MVRRTRANNAPAHENISNTRLRENSHEYLWFLPTPHIFILLFIDKFYTYLVSVHNFLIRKIINLQTEGTRRFKFLVSGLLILPGDKLNFAEFHTTQMSH